MNTNIGLNVGGVGVGTSIGSNGVGIGAIGVGGGMSAPSIPLVTTAPSVSVGVGVTLGGPGGVKVTVKLPPFPKIKISSIIANSEVFRYINIYNTGQISVTSS